METGKLNTLEVLKEVSFGIYLDGDEAGDILMPKRYVPEGTEIGDFVDVFVYRDSEDRLVATTDTPKAMVGQCAFLKVVATNKIGAFLDWGLPKDLLAPHNQQASKMVEDKSYLVYVYTDDRTNRIAASSKLSLFLKESGTAYQVGQQVDLQIASRSDLGYKAVINGTHLGVVFHSDVTQTLSMGQKVTGFIKRVRDEDQRIDLTLDADRAVTRKNLNKQILEHIEANEGVSKYTDRSAPADIQAEFGVSKSAFKKAIGTLYKDKFISINDGQINLVKKEAKVPTKKVSKKKSNKIAKKPKAKPQLKDQEESKEKSKED